MNMKKKSGFTLVELMIVVIIVGILAAVGIPMMSANTVKAKGTEAQAMIGTINTAGKLYTVERGSAPDSLTDLGDAGYLSNTDFADNKYFSTNDFTTLTFDADLGSVTNAVIAGDGVTVTFADGEWSTEKSAAK